MLKSDSVSASNLIFLLIKLREIGQSNWVFSDKENNLKGEVGGLKEVSTFL